MTDVVLPPTFETTARAVPLVWQPIESAPKDGTWFLAYRRSASFGVYSTLVAVCWHQESNDFVWPTDIFDVYNPPDLSAHDERGFLEVDVYEGQGSFTHWMPLPEQPTYAIAKAKGGA
jgi:hypothetical protein